jgi:hypothetical protein
MFLHNIEWSYRDNRITQTWGPHMEYIKFLTISYVYFRETPFYLDNCEFEVFDEETKVPLAIWCLLGVDQANEGNFSQQCAGEPFELLHVDTNLIPL